MSDVAIKNLTCAYDDKLIFEKFDITFLEGKINVILGGSGVGKSTLLNALAGLKEYEGEICGVEEGVSYIFQKDRLIPTVSVYKNLDLILRASVKGKDERKKRIENMLELLHVGFAKDKLPTELSGGEVQRVAMARAFLYESKVLLLDEPFKALDTALKSKLIRAFVELNESEKRTVIFVTHAIDECLLCADKYFVFAQNPVSIVLEGEIESDKMGRTLSSPQLAKTREQLLGVIVGGEEQ